MIGVEVSKAYLVFLALQEMWICGLLLLFRFFGFHSIFKYCIGGWGRGGLVGEEGGRGECHISHWIKEEVPDIIYIVESS